MITNIGLAELSHWLELPLALNIYNAYSKLLASVNRDIQNLKIMFSPGSSTSRNMRYSTVLATEDEEGFWSDDDGSHLSRRHPPVEIELYATRHLQPQPQPLRQQQPSVRQQQDKIPAINDEDDLMSAIIQTTANPRGSMGQDETDSDSKRREEAGKHGHRHRHRHGRKKEEANPPLPQVTVATRARASGLTIQGATAYMPEPFRTVPITAQPQPLPPVPEVPVMTAQRNGYDVI
jgi:hypothetical protein